MFKAAILAITVMLLAGCDVDERHQVGPLEHVTKMVDLGKSESARLELHMGAGELRLSGGSPNLTDADFEYNVASWKPAFVSHKTGSRADVKVEQGRGGASLGDAQNKAIIYLRNP